MSATILLGFLAAPLVGQEERFEETVDVTERVVTVEIPGPGQPDPGELVVVEGGADGEPLALDPIRPGDWTVLIYLDAWRTSAEAARQATGALGSIAERIVALGPAEVVVRGPEDLLARGPTGSATALASFLARAMTEYPGEDRIRELHRELSTEETRPPETLARWTEGLARKEIALVREADQALLEVASDRCSGPPCLLILVSNGHFQVLSPFYGESAPLSDSEWQQDRGSVARTLAVAGWTVLAYPAIPWEDDGSRPSRWSEYDHWAWDIGLLAPLLRIWPWTPTPSRDQRLPGRSIDTLLEPRWASLRELADASGGWILRGRQELPTLLSRLEDRRLLVYRAPVRGEEGPLSLEVLAGEEGRPLEAPRWVESPTAGSRPEAENPGSSPPES